MKRKNNPPIPPPSGALRCAFYARISPTGAKSDGEYANFSIQSQLHEMGEFARQQGWQTDRTLQFIDDRVSGESLERPALDRVRELVRARAIGVLLVFSTDRLTRTAAHLMLLADECERHGVLFKFVKENFDNTLEGKMMMQLKGVFNQYERLKFKERTTRCRRQKARDGYVHSVGKRYGYDFLGKKQGSKGELRIHPREAGIVRRIFAEYNRGERVYHIRARLNRDGVKSARGGMWSEPVIRQILKNPMYAGRMKGPGGITVKCPAIISEEIFAAAQARSKRNKTGRVGQPTRRYELVGRIWCALCEHRCTTWPGNRPEPNYRCNHLHRCTRKRLCEAKGVRQSLIERAVWEEVWGAVTEPETLYGFIEAHRARFASDTGNVGRERELAQLRRREQRAIEILNDPDVSFANAKERLQEITARIAAIEAEQKRAEVFQMPARRAVEALARTIREEEPESFEDRTGLLERLQIAVYWDSRTREVEIEGRFELPGQKNSRNGVDGYVDSFGTIPFTLKRRVA